MAKPHRWEWIPLKSIGGLIFDEPLPKDLGALNLERVEHPRADADENVDAFEEVGGDTGIFMEEGRVDTVYCSDNFFFKGRNLIGLTAEEAMEVIGGNWALEEEDNEMRVFSEDTLEVMIWEEDGVVQTIAVNGPMKAD